MIQALNLSKKYNRSKEIFVALDNVSLAVDKGDFCLVTGASGAGKSTLLYTLGGLIHPDSGEILYHGLNIYNQDHRFLDSYRRRNIGFMFQQFHLMPYLTVSENIQLACSGKNQHDVMHHYLEQCNLLELKYKYPSELSVGEKQRTAFVRAIISSPDILLADEPTGNLDPDNSSRLMSLIAAYQKDGGTVILASHDPAAARYAMQTIQLDKGKKVIPEFHVH